MSILFAGFIRTKNGSIDTLRNSALGSCRLTVDVRFGGIRPRYELRAEGSFWGSHRPRFYTPLDDYPVFHRTAIHSTEEKAVLPLHNRRTLRRWKTFTWA
jgi:hypothetical protein